MRSREMAEVRRAFLDAPFTPDGWLDALRIFSSATRSARAQLLGIGPTATLFNYMPDIEEAYQREFNEIEAWRPEVNWRVAVSGGTMEVLSERHYDAARAKLSSDIYDDHCRHWGGLYGAQTVLEQGDGELVGLAILRDETAGRTTAADRRAFADGADHARAAVRMQRAMTDRGVRLLAGALEGLDLAAFLLDRNGRVVAMTPEAEMILASGIGLRVAGGRLVGLEDRGRLQVAIARALAGDGDALPGTETAWVGHVAPTHPVLRCDVIRLPRDALPSRGDVRVLVVAHRPDVLPASAQAPLRQALGLTAAEAEIALRLADGTDREAIAAERATSTHTLSTQIKSVLAKSGVTREAELVALVNRLMR